MWFYVIKILVATTTCEMCEGGEERGGRGSGGVKGLNPKPWPAVPRLNVLHVSSDMPRAWPAPAWMTSRTASTVCCTPSPTCTWTRRPWRPCWTREATSEALDPAPEPEAGTTTWASRAPRVEPASCPRCTLTEEPMVGVRLDHLPTTTLRFFAVFNRNASNTGTLSPVTCRSVT